MKRNHQNNSFKPFQLPSKRPKALDHSSPSSSRAGFIDQRLVEGSQQPCYSPSPPKLPNRLLSPSQQEDYQAHLDAFDLELLACEDKEDPIRDSGLGLSRSTPLQTSHQPDLQPSQFSRFFDPCSSITAYRGSGSSSSDHALGLGSSPLALFHAKPRHPPVTGHGTETNYEQHQEDQSQQEKPPTTNYGTVATKGAERLFNNIPPSVRGIVLVPVSDLPENYRAMFSFPLFNAIQSKSFHPVYNSNDNIVISAPTGSGKTVIMELAICRLINVLKDERFKVVYQAPTKSLCSERFRDWHSKFTSLNLKCAELTGDTDHMQLRSVQSSQVIITTPEKWDSMTRKWKDHMKLMQLVKLFLIDEVHILKETRGATLEAVVSRMKNIGSNVRFLALSATVPNSEDIATWLGKDATNQHVPAHREHFGEEFRPVILKKVVYGYQSSLNDFAFDKVCGSKLSEVIEKHSAQKPIMIFCCTRNSALVTAKDLARIWSLTNPPARLWRGPQKRFDATNEDLKTTLAAGVAFHHAGLGPEDRHTVETGFKDGNINVICCTSTLAVGVNLPCHLVIIKNTVGWQDCRCKEYSDLEMMQMLGRAGRPQYDDSATAVILTKKDRVAHYERLVQGSESLESCLHLNLIDHLNAEIGLGNIRDIESAVKWLAGTFLFVRLRRNPTHYNLKEGANHEDEDELLRQICEKDVNLLRECELVETETLSSTQFGEAMARYYIRFETMKTLLSLKPKATLSETLNIISQASEFHEIRLKANEKGLYREINRDSGIRFPIKVDLALPAHKVSLLIQSELGGIDFPATEGFQKHRFTFNQDKVLVFGHVNRLIRCLIDCQIARNDSPSIRNALELARSLGAKVWDHSPLQMKQIEQIGVVAVRKLAGAGIRTIEALESTEAHEIEVALSRNPPFGSKLLARLREFPKLWVAVKMTGKDVKIDCVNIRFEVELAFMNDKTPATFQRKPVHVCCLTERSDGHLIDFRRMGANRIQDRLKIELNTNLTSADESVMCYVMCDEIAGTSRQAELKLDLPAHIFTKVRKQNPVPHDTARRVNDHHDSIMESTRNPSMNQMQTTHGFTAINKPQKTEVIHQRSQNMAQSNSERRRDLDDFDGDDLDLDDFLTVHDRRDQARQAKQPYLHREPQLDDVDWLSIDTTTPSPPKPAPKAGASREDDWAGELGEQEDEEYDPVRLLNGKWACNHKCKDKTSCKHFCCREGLDKPPPKPRKRTAPLAQKEVGQMTLPNNKIKAKAVGSASGSNTGVSSSKHHKIDSQTPTSIVKPSKSTPQLGKKPSIQPKSALAEKDKNIPTAKKMQFGAMKEVSSDYGDESFDDLPSPSQLLRSAESPFKAQPSTSAFQTKIKQITISDIINKPQESVDLSNESKEPHENRETQPTTPKESEIIVIPDDTPSQNTERSVPELESAALEKIQSEDSADAQSNHLKRKATEDEIEDIERHKRNPFLPPSRIPSFLIPESRERSIDPESPKGPLVTIMMPQLIASAGDPRASEAPEPRTWLQLNEHWLREDTDIVEDFNNIVHYI